MMRPRGAMRTMAGPSTRRSPATQQRRCLAIKEPTRRSGDYYDNQSTGDLESDAINTVILGSDPTVDYAWDRSNTPILEFSEDDPLLVTSWGIQDDTTVEEGELVLTQTNCTADSVDTPETTLETCTAWTVPEEAFCDNSLDVTVDVNDRIYTARLGVFMDVGRPPGSTAVAAFPNLNDPTWQLNWGIGTNGEQIGDARVLQAFGMAPGFDCSTITNIDIDIVGNFISVDPPTCGKPPRGRRRCAERSFSTRGHAMAEALPTPSPPVRHRFTRTLGPTAVRP